MCQDLRLSAPLQPLPAIPRHFFLPHGKAIDSHPVVGSVNTSGLGCWRLSQPQLIWDSKLLTDPRFIKPRARYGFANEAYQTLYADLFYDFGQFRGIPGQGY